MQDLNRNTKYQYSIPVCRENYYGIWGQKNIAWECLRNIHLSRQPRHERANEHTQKGVGGSPTGPQKRGAFAQRESSQQLNIGPFINTTQQPLPTSYPLLYYKAYRHQNREVPDQTDIIGKQNNQGAIQLIDRIRYWLNNGETFGPHSRNGRGQGQLSFLL